MPEHTPGFLKSFGVSLTLAAVVLLIWAGVAHLQAHAPTRTPTRTPTRPPAAFDEGDHPTYPPTDTGDTAEPTTGRCAAPPCEVA